MATPRIFISSTCYDLKEIRFQLRGFIEDVGYEPVMSDFGDIFYDLGQHVQDSCKDEILKSNVFILVIGNNYGSIYHKHSESNHLPDSVTLQEFRKAIAVGVPKYIFINRFVQHDFENYRRALSKSIAEYFSKNEVLDEKIEITKNSLKKQFDSHYPFPQDEYKYVFYFLDEIYNLDINNALYPFESFDEIKISLRKQWAGFFYESLTKEQNVPIGKIVTIERKLERIEHQLKLLSDNITSRNGADTISIDIANLTKEMNIDNLTELQNKIDEVLDEMLYEQADNYAPPLIRFTQKVSANNISKWFENIEKIIQDYKWSKNIAASVVFEEFNYLFRNNSYPLPHKLLLELSSIASSLNEKDKIALSTTIAAKFNELYEEPEPESERIPSEDVPF